MISIIQGKIAEINLKSLIIQVSGFGIEVQCPKKLLDSAKTGEEVKLFTHFEIKDETPIIYAFQNAAERTLFKELRSVNGVGARIAISLVGSFSPDQFAKAVEKEDEKLLCTLPGLGPKLAKRIILEIKGKLPKIISNEADNNTNSEVADCINALENLGWQRIQIVDKVYKAAKQNPDASTEDLIKICLKMLAAKNKDNREEK